MRLHCWLQSGFELCPVLNAEKSLKPQRLWPKLRWLSWMLLPQRCAPKTEAFQRRHQRHESDDREADTLVLENCDDAWRRELGVTY